MLSQVPKLTRIDDPQEYRTWNFVLRSVLGTLSVHYGDDMRVIERLPPTQAEIPLPDPALEPTQNRRCTAPPSEAGAPTEKGTVGAVYASVPEECCLECGTEDEAAWICGVHFAADHEVNTVGVTDDLEFLVDSGSEATVLREQDADFECMVYASLSCRWRAVGCRFANDVARSRHRQRDR